MPKQGVRNTIAFVESGGGFMGICAGCQFAATIGLIPVKRRTFRATGICDMRVISRPEHDPSDLVSYAIGAINEHIRSRRLDRARLHRSDRGVISAVRSYEAPLDRRLEETGFSRVAVVSLLMKEVALRVKEPALVPVGIR